MDEHDATGKVTVAMMFVLDPEAYVGKVRVDTVYPHGPEDVDH